VKSVLVILTQANLTSLQINESVSATMVLATFGISVKVLLKDAALSLLNNKLSSINSNKLLKLLPIWWTVLSSMI
jgi:hypothetical protein